MNYTVNITSRNPRRVRGAALLLVLLLLAIFSIFSLVWVYVSRSEGALADLYEADLHLSTAMKSAQEHAKASLAEREEDERLDQAQNGCAWVTLSTASPWVVRYRWNLIDNSAVPTNRLSWPAYYARRAARVVRTADGWRNAVDPHVASFEELSRVCREELHAHGLPEEHADELALTIADAFDANIALSTSPDNGTRGYEGLSLEAARRGDERVIPALAILRQSRFYDVDYEADYMNIFRAFYIDEVEPVVDPLTGSSNTRVRLSDAPFVASNSRELHREWDAFSKLWDLVIPHRFVPQAWQGVSAKICHTCGGYGGELTVLDNDTNYLYFAGYPIKLCAEKNFITLDLCGDSDVPGCIASRNATGIDIWLVTGLLSRSEYAFRFHTERDSVKPKIRVLRGREISQPHIKNIHDLSTGEWRRLETPAGLEQGAFVAFEVSYEKGLSLAAVHVRQADTIALRNRRTHPLYVSGWRWRHDGPERVGAPVVFDLCRRKKKGKRLSPRQHFTLGPGELWFWTTDTEMLPPNIEGLVSPVPADEAGAAFCVHGCSLEPSPRGGWAWKVSLAVHPDFPWKPDIWRGSVLRIVNDDVDDEVRAFSILKSGSRHVLVHVGPRSFAERLKPASGSRIALGSLADSLRRHPSELCTARGRVCAQVDPVLGRPRSTGWSRPEKGRWIPCRRPDTLRRCQTRNAAVPSALARLGMELEYTRKIHSPLVLANGYMALSPKGCNSTPDPLGASWASTRVAVKRAGRRRWRILSPTTGWPKDFWKDLELFFPGSGERLRITQSSGSSLTVDRRADAPDTCEAVISPGFSVGMWVSVSNRADGVWEWTLPDNVSLPVDAFLFGYQSISTNQPRSYTAFFWNYRLREWEPRCVTNMYNQHDAMRLGTLTGSHVSRGRVFRLRLAAKGSRAWMRGVYLLPRNLVGRLNIHSASIPAWREMLGGNAVLASNLYFAAHYDDARGQTLEEIRMKAGVPENAWDSLSARCARRSDAYTAQLEAEVLHAGKAVARRRCEALLVREWLEKEGRLVPRIQCAGIQMKGF